MADDTVTIGRRVVGFADYGPRDGVPVLWCHGGPGSRLEPAPLVDAATDAGLRLIGIDRPGYGMSTPMPGRTIVGWVSDALAVAGVLEIEHFAAAGDSTGGAYALALAVRAPERVLGVLACCAITDMQCDDCRATMSPLHAHAVWDAPDRAAAVAAALEAHGENGSRMVEMAAQLPLSDAALFADPAWLASMRAEAVPAMFAFGLEGYADDRIADKRGWVDFDVSTIRCPVIVLHGSEDVICDPRQAHHTAELVPGAELRIVNGLGHFSIANEVVPALVDLLGPASGPRLAGG